MLASTAGLSVQSNSLTGTIPSYIGLLTSLSESRDVWLLVMAIMIAFLFCSSNTSLSLFHSSALLASSGNFLTGTLPTEIGTLSALSESLVLFGFHCAIL